MSGKALKSKQVHFTITEISEGTVIDSHIDSSCEAMELLLVIEFIALLINNKFEMPESAVNDFQQMYNGIQTLINDTYVKGRDLL